MSVSKYAYDPAMCDGDICVGDCDLCDKPKIAQIHNTATSTTEDRSCNTCKHNNLPWHEEPCDSCCLAHDGYERKLT